MSDENSKKLSYPINMNRDWNQYCKDNKKYREKYNRRELLKQSEYYYGQDCRIIDNDELDFLSTSDNTKTVEILIIAGVFLLLVLGFIYLVKFCKRQTRQSLRNSRREDVTYGSGFLQDKVENDEV